MKQNIHTKEMDREVSQFRQLLAADRLSFIAETILHLQGGNLTPLAVSTLTNAIDEYRSTVEKK
jgi:hypothetical protein